MTFLSAVAFGLFAALILVGAVWVVTLRNLFRGALSLGRVLLGVGGAFLLLDAEFLGFVLILVYVGAILTLVVFAIMLTARLHAANPPARRQRLPAAISSLILFAVLVALTQSLAWPNDAPVEPVTLTELGQQLVTTLILPFEIISLVFVAAMIGAIALAAGRR